MDVLNKSKKQLILGMVLKGGVKMEKIKVKIEGKAPLLMNKFFIDTGTKTTRAKKVYVPEDEAEKKTYRDSEGNLFIPSTHFKASMVKAASDFPMKGKKTYKDYVKAGVFIEPTEIVLDQQEYEIHAEPVVIQRARVMSWRPKFKEWSCEFMIEITDEMINKDTLKDILIAAGKYKGVGDYRPEYGRFDVESYEIQ